MENPEEILHSLEEFSKTKPKDIPRELEEYLAFVAKTGDPIYQWPAIKSLFREKMVSVITEFYETCPSVEIPPCPNVDLFNYDVMKGFILEKLDTFAAAPFTLQRISELLTCPRKEYNRIDKYMRALEKNILVVSTTEPGGRRNTENGDGIMNGLESEHLPETSNSSNDINVEEMDDAPTWPRLLPDAAPIETPASAEPPKEEEPCSSTQDTVITCQASEKPYAPIEPPVAEPSEKTEAPAEKPDVSVAAVPAGVQKRRSSVEPVVSTETIEPTIEVARVEPAPSEPVIDVPLGVPDVKDADSSSNPEEDPETVKTPDPDTSSPAPEECSSDETTSTSTDAEPDICCEKNQVDTSQPDTSESDSSEAKEETPSESEEVTTVDTTRKCASPVVEDNSEISTSSDAPLEAVKVWETDETEAEAKVEVVEKKEEVPEVVVAVEKVVETSEVDEGGEAKVVESSSSNDSTPMDVDEDFSNSGNGKVGEVVKAEATSDSSL